MSQQLDSLFDELNQDELAHAENRASSSHADGKIETGGAEHTSSSQPTNAYAKSMLFVRGIPKDATNSELEEFFSEVGPIRACFVVGNNNNKKDDGTEGEAGKSEGDEGEERPVEKAEEKTITNRGFGFVQFVLAEDASRAIEELADTKFRGKKQLMLDFAMKKNSEKPAKPAKQTKPAKPAKRTRQSTEESGDDAHTAKKPKSVKSAAPSRTVLIEGIPKGVTKKQLIKKAKKSGQVHSVFYPVPLGSEAEQEDKLADGAGGNAHVTFETPEMAKKACKALNAHIFKGSKLTVKIKREFIDKNARLIVRNLPFKVRERELERVFSQCGTVLDVDLPRKYTGGPLRGFAFIQMDGYENAKQAAAMLDGHELHGRKVSVALAVAKDKFKEMRENGDIEQDTFDNEAADEDDVHMSDDDDGDVNDDDDAGADDNDSDEEKGEDEDEEMEDKEKEENKDSFIDTSLQEGCTIFIRNLSFDSDEDGLFDLFREFGKLRYCRVVYDHETGKSRGTAFVCFWNAQDAAKCIEAAEKAKQLSEELSSAPAENISNPRSKSVLLQDTPTSLDSTSKFVLDGRLLSVAKAVDRTTANNLASEGLQTRRSKDKRNVYLLKEGVIFPDTPAAKALAPADLEHHVKEYSLRKNQLFKNPNLYLSKTRLSVHNIPRPIDDKDLRAAAIAAIAKFKNEVKNGKRHALAKEEMDEGWDKVPRVVQAKIVRATDRVDAESGKGRSRGYGFLEFSTHAHALACLRYLNFRNTKQAFSKKIEEDEEEGDGMLNKENRVSRRSLRVMFSIENARVVKKREMRFSLAEKHAAAGDRRAQGESKDNRKGGKWNGNNKGGNGKAKNKRPSFNKGRSPGFNRPRGKRSAA